MAMAGRRPSARRLSELKGYTPETRTSRVDQSKRSFIPRLAGGDSLDRLSGVRPLEFDPPTSSRRFAHSTVAHPRNRSAENQRNTIAHQRPRAQSAQRPSFRFARSNSALSMETPINNRTAKTPMSTSSVNSCRSAGLRTPMNDKGRTLHWELEQALTAVPGKDKRPITDSNWQKITGNRVIAQLKEDKDFNVQSGTILLKPITIRTFLDINNHLLDKFGSTRFHVDNSNYIDKIPELARKLVYPGVMTKSWLKSVNAMHTYPNVLAYLSYLIDLAALNDEIQEQMSIDKIYGEDQKLMLRHNYYFEAWREFQTTYDSKEVSDSYVDDFKEVTESYIRDLKQLYDVRDEVFQNETREINELEKKKLEYTEKLENLKKDERNLQAKLNCFKSKRSDQKGNYVYYTNQIAEASKIIERKTKMLISAKEITEMKRKQVAALQEQLSQQKMDINQRNTYLKEINETNEVINSKEQLLIQIQKINYERDLMLASKQKKAFDACIAINKEILTIGLMAGKSFTNFSISERGLLMPGASEAINKTTEELKGLILESRADLQRSIEKNIRSHDLDKKIENIKMDVQTLNKKIDCLKSQIGNAEHRIYKARSERDAFAVKMQQALEKNMEAERLSEKTSEELLEWQTCDAEWREELKRLKEEEKLVHNQWNARVEMISKEFISISDKYIERYYK